MAAVISVSSFEERIIKVGFMRDGPPRYELQLADGTVHCRCSYSNRHKDAELEVYLATRNLTEDEWAAQNHRIDTGLFRLRHIRYTASRVRGEPSSEVIAANAADTERFLTLLERGGVYWFDGMETHRPE